MNKSRAKFTLPELQEQLDTLADGALFKISMQDCERLFGVDDVAATLLRNFAISHACAVIQADAAILFHKRFVQSEGIAQPSSGPEA